MGVLLFVAFWLLLGLTILFIALRGGPRQARATLYGESRRARRAAALVLLVAYLALGVIIPAVVIAAGRGQEADLKAGKKLNSLEQRGRDVFGKACVQCHTLAAANAIGRIGPNLDELHPPRALVLNAVLNGRARGNGRMPARIVQGRDAQAVAAFVAKVAGQQ
jgi:mono/diheme cytochrome c family protein